MCVCVYSINSVLSKDSSFFFKLMQKDSKKKICPKRWYYYNNNNNNGFFPISDGSQFKHSSSSPSSSSSATQELKHQKLQELEEQYMCSICMERHWNMAFVCGHTTCKECGDVLKQCHMCRKPIQKKILLYWRTSVALTSILSFFHLNLQFLPPTHITLNFLASLNSSALINIFAGLPGIREINQLVFNIWIKGKRI